MRISQWITLWWILGVRKTKNIKKSDLDGRSF